MLETVYRQKRELILEDLDNEGLQQLAFLLKSGTLQCLRSLSVSQTNVEDESVVTEFVGSLADGVCSDLRHTGNCSAGMAGTEYPGGMYGFGNRSGRLWSHPDYSVSGNKGKNDGFP